MSSASDLSINEITADNQMITAVIFDLHTLSHTNIGFFLYLAFLKIIILL